MTNNKIIMPPAIDKIPLFGYIHETTGNCGYTAINSTMACGD